MGPGTPGIDLKSPKKIQKFGPEVSTIFEILIFGRGICTVGGKILYLGAHGPHAAPNLDFPPLRTVGAQGPPRGPQNHFWDILDFFEILDF